MEVKIEIISPESFLNITFLELFNFCCGTMEDVLGPIYLRNTKI